MSASSVVPVVHDSRTQRHDPRHEIWVGKQTVGTEVPERVERILKALTGHRMVPAAPHPVSDLWSVHDPALVEFLRTAVEEWQEGTYREAVGQDRVVPYYFPTQALLQGMPPTSALAVHARAGQFDYDTMTLLGPGSWEAISGAADCALTAADLVSSGAHHAVYALCRPPGHHATRHGFGGSCYLNNAALAAQRLLDSGLRSVGVLDLDAHHGNGTQAIFWDRSDVRFASLHVDPGAGWFPHIFGYASETGAGEGDGATRNRPLPEGTPDGPWLEAVADLAEWLSRCEAVVVSLGVDAAADDPESPLLVTDEGYHAAGRIVARLGLPTVVVQEGGYHLPSLGGLVAAHLEGLTG